MSIMGIFDRIDQPRLDLSDRDAGRAGCNDIVGEFHFFFEVIFAQISLFMIFP